MMHFPNISHWTPQQKMLAGGGVALLLLLLYLRSRSSSVATIPVAQPGTDATGNQPLGTENTALPGETSAADAIKYLSAAFDLQNTRDSLLNSLGQSNANLSFDLYRGQGTFDETTREQAAQFDTGNLQNVLNLLTGFSRDQGALTPTINTPATTTVNYYSPDANSTGGYITTGQNPNPSVFQPVAAQPTVTTPTPITYTNNPYDPIRSIPTPVPLNLKKKSFFSQFDPWAAVRVGV